MLSHGGAGLCDEARAKQVQAADALPAIGEGVLLHKAARAG
jgi:hypothetical protein